MRWRSVVRALAAKIVGADPDPGYGAADRRDGLIERPPDERTTRAPGRHSVDATADTRGRGGEDAAGDGLSEAS